MPRRRGRRRAAGAGPGLRGRPARGARGGRRAGRPPGAGEARPARAPSHPVPARAGGSGAEEEADLPQVHLPRRGPGPAAGHVLRAADAAVQRPAAAAAEPRPAEEAALAAEASAQSQEGGAAHGEAGGGEDAPAGHDHPARDGGQHGGRLQRQDLQPSGDQARDDRSLPGRVLHHLQAGEAWPAWHRSHPLFPLHSPQVVCLANKGPAPLVQVCCLLPVVWGWGVRVPGLDSPLTPPTRRGLLGKVLPSCLSRLPWVPVSLDTWPSHPSVCFCVHMAFLCLTRSLPLGYGPPEKPRSREPSRENCKASASWPGHSRRFWGPGCACLLGVTIQLSYSLEPHWPHRDMCSQTQDVQERLKTKF